MGKIWIVRLAVVLVRLTLFKWCQILIFNVFFFLQTAELDDIVFDTDAMPINGATINGNFRKRAASAPSDALEEKNAFVKNILFDVCSDFERTLERTSSRKRSTPNYNGNHLVPMVFIFFFFSFFLFSSSISDLNVWVFRFGSVQSLFTWIHSTNDRSRCKCEQNIHNRVFAQWCLYVCRLPITIKWWLKEWSDGFGVWMRAAHTPMAHRIRRSNVFDHEFWVLERVRDNIYLYFFPRISDDKIRTTLTQNLRYFIWLGEKFQAWTRARTALVNICAIRCVLLYTSTSGIA